MSSHPAIPAHPTRPTARGVAAVLAALGVLAVVTCSFLASAPPAAAAAGRQYGRGPVDAVVGAAQAYVKCSGLTTDELAAMMMVPTYPETGGTVPSPMTLSRWDNVNQRATNANLFAFGQTSGPYVNAFFSPGIGMWQFDSAGAWNLTAATAIDAVTAASQAASTIGYRYCNAPLSIPRDDVSLRRYAWGPWYGCSTSSNSNCETIYSQLLVNGRLDVAAVDGVSRYGGMELRSCDVVGLGRSLECWYVDPARSQGSTGWRNGTYDPTKTTGVTPLPKPFYVVAAGGQEYRIWITADTGYDTGITAHKPITANARTALVWERKAGLCDQTAKRGDCIVDIPLPSTDKGSSYTILSRGSNSPGFADTTVTFGPVRPASILMCDWNGDGVETPGSFTAGWWTISNAVDGSDARVLGYGDAGDIPVCGDWDGNGTETPAIIRSGTWYLTNQLGATRADMTVMYGNPNDVPLVGDWDGNGTDSMGVYRSGAWYITNSVATGRADKVFLYGNPTGDLPLVGDWDNDGVDEPVIFRSGYWFLGSGTGNPVASSVFPFGNSDDVPRFGRWSAGAPSSPAVLR